MKDALDIVYEVSKLIKILFEKDVQFEILNWNLIHQDFMSCLQL